MNTAANAALSSWNVNSSATYVLLLALLLYFRGWLRGRSILRDPQDARRLACFIAGLTLIFFALVSPLDAFDSLFLSAHMAQHLLLMMLAPPLLLLGKPWVPLLRGLPRAFVKEGLAPFLVWPPLKRFAALLVHPVSAWLLFAASTIAWHLPAAYQLALRSSHWHAVQHACFFWSGILFWWPLLESRKHGGWPEWAFIPYLLFADFVNTGLSAFFVFSGKLLYPTYGLVQTAGIRPADDQILAGLIMWVPGSLVYLVPAFTLAMRVFSSRAVPTPSTLPRVRSAPGPVSRWSSGLSLKFLAPYRVWLQATMLLLALIVMYEGFFGPQIAPLNLAGTLPWIYWRALSLAALLLIGNLFCMACPFVLVRDWGRRAGMPARFRWPRALRNKWLAASLFVLYLWAYEALGLWNSPWLTAWIIAGYFLAAFVVDGFFRGAVFCKYVCPIGQFHFVSSLLSPREVAVRKREVCQACRTFDCIKGNTRQRGCELDLFQPKKAGNLDCTFCLDCVKACPHDNIALVTVTPAKTLLANTYRSSIGRLVKRLDWLALILIVTFGAFANAAGMADPVMLWEHHWHAFFGPHSLPWIIAAFIITVTIFAPVALIALSSALSFGMKTSEAARRFALLLAPLGIGMWAAHIAYHALGASFPDVIPFEILLLDAGVLVALYLIWQAARKGTAAIRPAVILAAPWATLALGLYAAGLWILFQPMQMRGMM